MAPRWLALLVVPLCARANALDLPDALAFAMEHAPALQGARAVEAAAQGRFEQVRAASLPKLTVGASHVWLASHALDDAHHDASLSSTLGQTTLSVPLVDVRAWLDASEAHAEQDLASAEVASRRRLVALTAGRAWIAVRTEQHALQARLEALRTAREHLSWVTGRAEHGAATTLDEVRARRELAAITAQVEASRAAVTRARERLGVALGADEPVDIIDGPAPLETTRFLAAERPDLTRALEVWREANDVAAHGWADYLPTVTFVGQAFAQDVPTAALPVSGVGLVGQVVLSVPLFDGGRRYGTQRTRDAVALDLATRVSDLSHQVHAEERVGHDVHRHAVDALAATRDAALWAHRALELTQARFREGVGNGLDVIDALREARDADLQVALAEDRERLTALDELAAAGRLD